MATKKTIEQERFVTVKFTSTRDNVDTYTYRDELETPLQELDLVLAPTRYGYALATVQKLSSKNDTHYSNSQIKSIAEKLSSEVIEAEQRLEKAKLLTKKIEKKVKESNQLEMFRKAAEGNPELQAMVDELAALQTESK